MKSPHPFWVPECWAKFCDKHQSLLLYIIIFLGHGTIADITWQLGQPKLCLEFELSNDPFLLQNLNFCEHQRVMVKPLNVFTMTRGGSNGRYNFE